MDTRKQTICAMLRTFIQQRPGLEFCNYGNWPAYRAELRSIGTDLKHARTLLSAVEQRDSIGADDILRAAKGAYSGRLHIEETESDRFKLDYCTGQYWPTEYRRAVCAVLSSALWDYWRADMQPTGWRVRCLLDEPGAVYGLATSKVFPTEAAAAEYAATVANARHAYADPVFSGMRAGDYLRKLAREEFGLSIANRWFN